MDFKLLHATVVSFTKKYEIKSTIQIKYKLAKNIANALYVIFYWTLKDNGDFTWYLVTNYFSLQCIWK